MRNKIILTLLYCFISCSALAEENKADSVAGTIQYNINKSNHQCEFLLNNKVILNFDCGFSYTPQLLGTYNGSFGEFIQVLIFQESPMGNACNGGSLHLIGIRKDKSQLIIKPIDFCGGADPAITNTQNSINITFPGGPPNIGEGTIPTESWVFNGKLTKN